MTEASSATGVVDEAASTGDLDDLRVPKRTREEELRGHDRGDGGDLRVPHVEGGDAHTEPDISAEERLPSQTATHVTRSLGDDHDDRFAPVGGEGEEHHDSDDRDHHPDRVGVDEQGGKQDRDGGTDDDQLQERQAEEDPSAPPWRRSGPGVRLPR
ncbi:hypothetical protein ACRAWC_21840 [Leifsonia sp. L25]|uniref:hypothetical protein n=1 Tax=Leifsonia sp. L25 TaxID=3423957 RepID=UPI003D68E976